MAIAEYLIGDPEYVYPRFPSEPDLVKVEISTLITSRDVPQPPIDFLPSMPLRYWMSMDWMLGTYDQYEVQGFGWWPADYRDQPLADFERYGAEHRIADPVTKTVDVWYDIEPWSPEEIETEILRRIEIFKTQIYAYVRPRLNAFAKTRQYEDLRDCISYYNSNYPSIKAEADRAIELRDTFRLRMFEIIEEVEDRTIPIPQLEEFDSLNWPVLIWEVGPPIEPETPPIENNE